MISFHRLNTFVVWNVGQGQWLTWINLKGQCFHIDVGGEFPPWKQLFFYCQKNHFYILTHQDLDHRKFLRHLQKKALVKEISPNIAEENQIAILARPIGKKENEKSLWILLKNQILVTGDSPRKIEKQILSSMSSLKLQKVQFFILGHHGSRTSNSPQLLDQLPQIKAGIASARWGRFYHPHPEVVHEFQKRKTPLLLTEKWGHLFFQL